MPNTVRITVELEDNEAWELAQFVKRSTWEQYRACAVDDDEADVIRTAIVKLEQGLHAAAYRPR